MAQRETLRVLRQEIQETWVLSLGQEDPLEVEGSPGKAAWVLVGDPRVTAGGMTEVVHKAEGQGLAFGPGVSHLSLGVLGTAVTALALQGRLT